MKIGGKMFDGKKSGKGKKALKFGLNVAESLFGLPEVSDMVKVPQPEVTTPPLVESPEAPKVYVETRPRPSAPRDIGKGAIGGFLLGALVVYAARKIGLDLPPEIIGLPPEMIGGGVLSLLNSASASVGRIVRSIRESWEESA